MRKLTFEQGRNEIQWVLDKYRRKMRDKVPYGVVENILHAVEALEGPEIANALITLYELWSPYYGSHEWRKDGHKHHPKVVHLEPDFKVPDEWRIYPGDKDHPGTITIRLKGEEYNV